MDNIDLSIIVPVFNVEGYLKRALDSILLQPSSITYEILLIDDGSNDKSGAICDEYQSNFSNIFVSHIENNGVAEARNLGISLSRGNYLYFMDPDDFLSDDFFEQICPNLNGKWDVLCFGYNEIKENSEKEKEDIKKKAEKYANEIKAQYEQKASDLNVKLKQEKKTTGQHS